MQTFESPYNKNFMDKNYIDFNLPPKKKSLTGLKIFSSIIFGIIFLFADWIIFKRIDFANATPMDLLVIIFIAIFGGLIVAFHFNHEKTLLYLFDKPSSDQWAKAFYYFVAISFVITILLFIVMLIFYKEIFQGDMFRVLFHKQA